MSSSIAHKSSKRKREAGAPSSTTTSPTPRNSNTVTLSLVTSDERQPRDFVLKYEASRKSFTITSEAQGTDEISLKMFWRAVDHDAMLREPHTCSEMDDDGEMPPEFQNYWVFDPEECANAGIFTDNNYAATFVSDFLELWVKHVSGESVLPFQLGAKYIIEDEETYDNPMIRGPGGTAEECGSSGRVSDSWFSTYSFLLQDAASFVMVAKRQQEETQITSRSNAAKKAWATRRNNQSKHAVESTESSTRAKKAKTS